MRTENQLLETVQRFRDCFWDRKISKRPVVGIYSDAVFLPMNFLRRPFSRSLVQPEDVTPELAMTEYEYWFRERDREVSCDDQIAFAAAWRAIPWLEACCGCPVRYAEGALAPGCFVGSAEALETIPIPGENGWFECLRRQTEWLEDQAAPDCWISPTILRGCSDVLAAMRGLPNFLMDLHDNPQAIKKAARRVNRLLLEALDLHYSIVKPKLGGYGHKYGYWAPDRTQVMQEDAMGMCSPAMYRDIFMEGNAEVVKHLGSYVIFHLHSTGYKHYQDVLSMPNIAGLEIYMEQGGPTLIDLLPVLREILDRSRLILHVDYCFEQLPQVLRKLPTEGLFLAISNLRIRSDAEFRDFIAAQWGAN
jgi:hypothetical protein